MHGDRPRLTLSCGPTRYARPRGRRTCTTARCGPVCTCRRPSTRPRDARTHRALARPDTTRRPATARGLDLVGASLPLPRGTRRDLGTLGGVPTAVVAPPGPLSPHRVLYLHGGGLPRGLLGVARPLLAGLAHATGGAVLAPHYRLAPEHPFPAALDDAYAAWTALRAAGIPARHIAVAGDSAGGGLTMSAAAAPARGRRGLPGSIGLISPWLGPVLHRGTRSPATSPPTPCWTRHGCPTPSPTTRARTPAPPSSCPSRRTWPGCRRCTSSPVPTRSSSTTPTPSSRRARAAGTPVTYERAPACGTPSRRCRAAGGGRRLAAHPGPGPAGGLPALRPAAHGTAPELTDGAGHRHGSAVSGPVRDLSGHGPGPTVVGPTDGYLSGSRDRSRSRPAAPAAPVPVPKTSGL